MKEKLYTIDGDETKRAYHVNTILDSFGWNITDFQPKAGELGRVLHGKTPTDPIPHLIFSQKDVDAAETALQGAIDRSMRAHKREEAKRAKKTAPVIMEPIAPSDWQTPIPMGAENEAWANARLRDIQNGTIPDTTINDGTQKLINATAWVKEKIGAMGDFLSQPFSSIKQTFRWLSRLVSW